MKPLLNMPRTDAPTAAYINGRTIRTAGLMCPYCQHRLHAHDFEVVDDNVRAVCTSCHCDLLAIEM
jgi:hypothetical protein